MIHELKINDKFVMFFEKKLLTLYPLLHNINVHVLRTLIYEMLNVLCWCKVLNGIDNPETVRKAIDIAKYNYEKKVEERKSKKNLQ